MDKGKFLLVVFLGIVVIATLWLLQSERRITNDGMTNQLELDQSEQKTNHSEGEFIFQVIENQDGTNTYSNRLLGIEFEYPSLWGVNVAHEKLLGSCPSNYDRDNCSEVMLTLMSTSTGGIVFNALLSTPGVNRYPSGRGATILESGEKEILANILKNCVRVIHSECNSFKNDYGVWVHYNQSMSLHSEEHFYRAIIPLPHSEYVNFTFSLGQTEPAMDKGSLAGIIESIVYQTFRFIDDEGRLIQWQYMRNDDMLEH